MSKLNSKIHEISIYKNNLYEKKIKNNWIFMLFFHPDVYLYKLIFNTIFVGIIAFSLTYVCLYNDIHITIPATAHQLVGVAIGLLLVYRTQTAYERWSTASKNFNEIYNILVFINMKLQTFLMLGDDRFQKVKQNELADIIKDFTLNFKTYLKSSDSQTSEVLEIYYLEGIKQMFNFVSKLENESDLGITRSDTNLIHKAMQELINSCGSCVKIKNTPIPISYALHIKVSIFLYILALPFGLFSSLGLWSAVMVMFIYYIIAGIEIISKEIENPFEGSPNDLDMESWSKKIDEITKNKN